MVFIPEFILEGAASLFLWWCFHIYVASIRTLSSKQLPCYHALMSLSCSPCSLESWNPQELQVVSSRVLINPNSIFALSKWWGRRNALQLSVKHSQKYCSSGGGHVGHAVITLSQEYRVRPYQILSESIASARGYIRAQRRPDCKTSGFASIVIWKMWCSSKPCTATGC